MIMNITMMTTGMTSTGKMITGVTVIGYIIHMDTTVPIMSGGTRGGGMSSGSGAIGVITSHGISSIVDSTLFGMMMAAGGSGRDTVAG
jgi:hypothetical protein